MAKDAVCRTRESDRRLKRGMCAENSARSFRNPPFSGVQKSGAVLASPVGFASARPAFACGSPDGVRGTEPVWIT